MPERGARMRADLRRMAALRIEDTLGHPGYATHTEPMERLLIALCEATMWIIKEWPNEEDIQCQPSSSTGSLISEARAHSIHQLRNLLQQPRPSRRSSMDGLVLVLAEGLHVIADQWPPQSITEMDQSSDYSTVAPPPTPSDFHMASTSFIHPQSLLFPASTSTIDSSNIAAHPEEELLDESEVKVDVSGDAVMRQLLLIQSNYNSNSHVDEEIHHEEILHESDFKIDPKDKRIKRNIKGATTRDKEDRLKRKKKRRAFEFYWEERRGAFAKSHSHLGHNERRAIAQAEWRNVTDRQRWQNMADEYNERMSEEKYRRKPKPPVTANAFFFKEHHKLLREKNPHLRGCDILTEIGRMWEKCEDKSRWMEMQSEDRKRYESEMAVYRTRKEEEELGSS